MTSFSRRKTSLSKARTAELSWLHVSNKCTNVIISILPSFPFLVATVICHGRSLLPNQSVWLSLNFFGRYFIARSETSKAEVSSSSSMTSSLNSSWNAVNAISRNLCIVWTVKSQRPNLLSYRLCLPLPVQLSRFLERSGLTSLQSFGILLVFWLLRQAQNGGMEKLLRRLYILHSCKKYLLGQG